MCLLLQCHKCVCFATLMKLCHDLIQSAFKKWLHVAIHFIQSDGWGVTIPIQCPPLLLLPFALVLSLREEIRLKMCDEAL